MQHILAIIITDPLAQKVLDLELEAYVEQTIQEEFEQKPLKQSTHQPN